jgi:hypothetical protein
MLRGFVVDTAGRLPVGLNRLSRDSLVRLAGAVSFISDLVNLGDERILSPLGTELGIAAGRVLLTFTVSLVLPAVLAAAKGSIERTIDGVVPPAVPLLDRLCGSLVSPSCLVDDYRIGLEVVVGARLENRIFCAEASVKSLILEELTSVFRHMLHGHLRLIVDHIE